jgi:PhoPQ-activated pathogenicity-related protein
VTWGDEILNGIIQIEKALGNLIEKYGDEFTWGFIPFTQARNHDSFLTELRAELTETHPLCNRKISRAVAKCYANDDVLFLSEDERYYIVHLTYTKTNSSGFPRYIDFLDLESAMKHIEEQYLLSI